MRDLLMKQMSIVSFLLFGNALASASADSIAEDGKTTCVMYETIIHSEIEGVEIPSEWVCVEEGNGLDNKYTTLWHVDCEDCSMEEFVGDHGISSGQQTLEIAHVQRTKKDPQRGGARLKVKLSSTVNVVGTARRNNQGQSNRDTLPPGSQGQSKDNIFSEKRNRNLRSLRSFENDSRVNSTAASTHRQLQDRSSTAIGARSLLVIRGIGTDPSPTIPTVSAMYNNIWNPENQYTTVDRFLKCSVNQLQLESDCKDYCDIMISGVLKVQLSIPIFGVDKNVAQDAILTKAEEMVGALTKWDHVMLAMPAQVDFSGALAYAQKNGWLSVYKGRNIVYHGITLHEIGHNLGASHSGQVVNGVYNQYEDHTCLMGAPDREDLQCFNGAKSWFFGWYADREISISIDELSTDPTKSWTGQVAGMNDYSRGLTIQDEHYVVVQILGAPTNPDDTLYIMYNRAEEITSAVDEFPNKVTIVQARNEDAISYQSNLLAGLDVGDEYQIEKYSNFDYDLKIVFNGVSQTGLLDLASVTIYLTAPVPSAVPSQRPSHSPSAIPSRSPSILPSQSPSESSNPSMYPSEVPSYSVEPSTWPSIEPSLSSFPSVLSSSVPSLSLDPSLLPSEQPSTSMDPSILPTLAPSASSNPSLSPTSSPSLSPSSSPSNFPSLSFLPSGCIIPDRCGDGICQDGEDCESCPSDCRKGTRGGRVLYCCYGGPTVVDGTDPIARSCDSSKCSSGRYSCSLDPSPCNENGPGGPTTNVCTTNLDCATTNGNDDNVCVDHICGENGSCQSVELTRRVGYCGDGICQFGETCETCSNDCSSRSGKKNAYCCYGGNSIDTVPIFYDTSTYDESQMSLISCDDSRCQSGGGSTTCDLTDYTECNLDGLYVLPSP